MFEVNATFLHNSFGDLGSKFSFFLQMQDNRCSQIYLAQSIVQKFVSKRNPDFNSFIEVWKDLNANQIHSLPSPRPLLFGRCQTAYQTFLGFILSKKNELDIIAGLYGIYFLFETQNLPIKEPILITPDQLIVISNKIQKIKCLHAIFKFLLQSKAFLFSGISYEITTQFTEFPPQTVPIERPPFTKIMETKKEKYIKKNLQKEVKQLPEIEENQSYHSLLSEIFQSKEEKIEEE